MSDRLAIALVLGLLAAASRPVAARDPVPDPTRPAVPAPTLLLQSTLVSPRQRSAIINGQRYRPGDRLGDARIEAIGPGWVRLATPTGPAELRLSYPTLTRPVNR